MHELNYRKKHIENTRIVAGSVELTQLSIHLIRITASKVLRARNPQTTQDFRHSGTDVRQLLQPSEILSPIRIQRRFLAS